MSRPSRDRSVQVGERYPGWKVTLHLSSKSAKTCEVTYVRHSHDFSGLVLISPEKPQLAAGVPVVWDDREVFVIQQPKPDTVEQVRTFIEGYPGKCGCAEPQYHSHLLLSLTKMVSNFT